MSNILDIIYNKYISYKDILSNIKEHHQDVLFLDFETTNKHKGSPLNEENRIVLACWYFQGKNNYSFQGLDKLFQDLDKCKMVVAHNAKFELGWLRREGYDLHKLDVFCTQVAEYTLVSNLKGKLDLNSCLDRHGIKEQKKSLVSLMIDKGICPSEIPKNLLLEYCLQDINVLRPLIVKQAENIIQLGLDNVLFTRNLLVPVLADIEFNGLDLDPSRVIEAYNVVYKKYIDTKEELRKFIGDRNPNSNKQMAELLYSELGFSELKDRKGNAIRTEKNQPKTDVGTIAKLRARNRKQKEFIALKLKQAKLGAQLTKALNKLKLAVDNNNLKIFASFNQTITDTGRLSSTGMAPYNIQLHNIQREHKALFWAPEDDWEMMEADAKQLEFRSAGELTGDKQIKEDIENSIDVHSVTAEIITKAGQETSRQNAKAHTFKPLYGGETGTKAEVEYYKFFKEKYNTCYQVQTDWVYEALNKKYIATITGQRFYFPNLKVQGNYIAGHQQVRNYPVQYFATGEIIPALLILLWMALYEEKMASYLVNTVHDSVILKCYMPERELLEQMIVYIASTLVPEYFGLVYSIKLTIPLEMEISSGKHWKNSDTWIEDILSRI